MPGLEQQIAAAVDEERPTLKVILQGSVIELDPNDAVKILGALDSSEEDDGDEGDSGKKIEVSTKRQPVDVDKLPRELIKELEEKSRASSIGFIGGKSRLQFPGDGLEMVIGG